MGRSRLSPTDLARTAWLGVAGRPQRTMLAALGIALGVAALVALTGVSASNRAHVLAELDRLGADLAVVVPGTGADGLPVPLPGAASESIARQPGVARVGVLETAPAGLAVYRSDLMPEGESNGLTVTAARPDLLAAVGTGIAAGRWFDEASRGLPVAVLGADAAARLGIDRPGDRVWIGGEWYGVLGVLSPAGLAAEIDTSAILGDRWVREHLGGPTAGAMTRIYVRAERGQVERVRAILAAAASPAAPQFVSVTGLRDLAGARAVADDSLAALGVALGAIALLVGGLGIANTMVVSVLERRGEIGLRRALGARPGQIAAQFVTEASVLSALGGLAGLAVGCVAVAVIAALGGQPCIIPPTAAIGGPVLALVVGALAGLQPAIRAARTPPGAALRTG